MKEGASGVKAVVRRIGLLVAMWGLFGVACGSDGGGLPGGNSSTTATSTTTFGQDSTTSAPITVYTAPTLEPNVVAATAGRQPSLRRVDVPLTLNAPTMLVAASPSAVVAMGWRGVGNTRLAVSTVRSTDGQQWRLVDTPWTDPTTEAASSSYFGIPTALAYADGLFLSLGVRFDVSTQRGTPLAAQSVDGIKWQTVDLQPTIGSASPTQLVRYGDRWVMLAQPTDTNPARHTIVFVSTDGSTWERVAQLDFAVLHVAASSTGLVVAGSVGENNLTRWLTATSADVRQWNVTPLPLGPLSPVHAMLVDAGRVVIAVSENTSTSSTGRRIRLLSSGDGGPWRSLPSPPCFVVGELAAGAAVANGTWAIASGEPTPKLATSIDQGASWSCTELRGATFESQPSFGPPYVAQLTEVQGKLALVGGRVIEPGAKSNWGAAIWYAT